MKNKIKSIVLYAILLFLIIYVSVAIFIPQKSTKIFGFRTFIIVSTSMEPEIDKHDMILITSPNIDKLQVGDIITFKAYIIELHEYSYVTHFIGAIEDVDGETIYKTQGAGKDEGDYDNWIDHNGNNVDITFEDIEGTYQFTIPLIGDLVWRLQDPIFVGLLLLNGAVIYFAYKMIIGYFNEKDEKKESD